MPVLIADKPDGQVSLPGLQLDQYHNVLGSHLCADGSESLQMLVVARMSPSWRWSDALTTMTGGPRCGMGGYLASGALHLVTPDEVQTVNAGQCFGFDDDALIDMFTADETVCCDQSGPAGLARLVAP